MDPLLSHKSRKFLRCPVSLRGPVFLLCILLCVPGCYHRMKYQGTIDFSRYPHLKGKKIFIDPGHGGLSGKDLFRNGPGGITEEEVNLRVALVLQDMMRKAGAKTILSRTDDSDVPLAARVEAARNFSPDVLVSIHHNGSARRMDNINYPCVLIWGSDMVNPSSGELARLVLGEFHRIMDEKGRVLSDFSVYPETGTMILRETRYLCPGILGEAGFFSDDTHAVRLRDTQYNQLEAEAYFYALSSFLSHPLPDAEVAVSVPVTECGMYKNVIGDKAPVIALRLKPGVPGTVPPGSVTADLDDMPVSVKSISVNTFTVEVGGQVYPGIHRLRFSYTDTIGRQSSIFSASFTTPVTTGDFNRLVDTGTRRIKRKGTARDGLMMLLSALSLERTGPESDTLIWNIARGFAICGFHEQSRYYFSKLYHFYPDSPYRKKLPKSVSGHRFPVEFHGKPVPLVYDPHVLEKNVLKHTIASLLF